jgi:transposase
LAAFLQKRLLRSVDVPSPEARAHREVARRRRSFIQDRVQAQNRIKAFLRFTGLELPRESRGRWSQAFVENLWRLRLVDPYHQESFENLLRQFEGISKLVDQQTQLLRKLSRSEQYAHQVELLETIPGVGWLTAIELILELRDMRRFRTARSIGAYVGLTPSQMSSGEHTRLGRVTKQGRASIRALLVEASWRLIRKDPAMEEVYRRIANRSGGKRAIVAIARRLVTRMRRLLLDDVPYQLGVVA